MSESTLSNIFNSKTAAFEQQQYGVHTSTPFLEEIQQLDSAVVLESQGGGNCSDIEKSSIRTPSKENTSELINTGYFLTESRTPASTFYRKVLEICGTKISLAYIYSAGVTAAVIALLLLFVKNQNRVKEENNRTTYENLPKIMVSPLPGLSVGGNHIITLNDWNQVEKFGSDEHNNIIHFNVGGNKQELSEKRSQRDTIQYNNDPTATIDDGALRIFGKPKFCHHSDYDTPESLTFKNILHLHLSEMENCHHYMNLILTKWNFPNVRSIRLQGMVVEKGEFLGLTKFIERNNETLEKVEIDESYICPSPFCDAGMVDFPNHDFKFSITRRRESPKWI